MFNVVQSSKSTIDVVGIVHLSVGREELRFQTFHETALAMLQPRNEEKVVDPLPSRLRCAFHGLAITVRRRSQAFAGLFKGVSIVLGDDLNVQVIRNAVIRKAFNHVGVEVSGKVKWGNQELVRGTRPGAQKKRQGEAKAQARLRLRRG